MRMAHDEHEGVDGVDEHDGWPMMGMMDEGCSHTYEDGPHEAHDGWAWDSMAESR
jgi:hypothetical protein